MRQHSLSVVFRHLQLKEIFTKTLCVLSVVIPIGEKHQTDACLKTQGSEWQRWVWN